MIEEIVRSQAPIKVYVNNCILLLFNCQLKLFKRYIWRFYSRSNCKFVSLIVICFVKIVNLF